MTKDQYMKGKDPIKKIEVLEKKLRKLNEMSSKLLPWLLKNRQ